MTAADVIAAVREVGADISIGNNGPRILNGSRVPATIVALCREHREAIIAEIARPVQLALDLAAAPPLSFLDAQQAKFDRLCAEFGIPIAPPASKGVTHKAA